MQGDENDMEQREEQRNSPWIRALRLAEPDHNSIWSSKVGLAALAGWQREVDLMHLGRLEPRRPGELDYLRRGLRSEADDLPGLAEDFRRSDERFRNEDERRCRFHERLQRLIHIAWPLGLIETDEREVWADVHAKRFILDGQGLWLWTEFGRGRRWGRLQDTWQVGEGLLVLDGKASAGAIPGAPLEVAERLKSLPPTDDWWWSWEERCLRSFLLRTTGRELWVADQMREQLRRVLRVSPEGDDIQIENDEHGDPIARYPLAGTRLDFIHGVAFQDGALRAVHESELCGFCRRGGATGVRYSPEIACLEDLGWADRLWIGLQVHPGAAEHEDGPRSSVSDDEFFGTE